MVTEVEASVDPDSILGNGHIFLGVNGPLARQGDLLVEGCRAHLWRKAVPIGLRKEQLSEGWKDEGEEEGSFGGDG